MFGIPGLVLLAIGLLFGTHVLTTYSSTNTMPLGWALGTVLLCLAGLLGLSAALMLQAMKELLHGEVARMEEKKGGYESGNRDNRDIL